MKIIVADDEFYTRKALSKCISESFRKCGTDDVSIIECDRAEAVLEKLKESLVDVVFTDIRMGEVDGLTLCEILHAKYPNIQLVIISGYAEFNYAQKAMQSDVFRYLLKPVDEEEIYTVASELLQRCATLQTGAAMSPDNEVYFSDLTDIDMASSQYALMLLRLNSDQTSFPENLSCLSAALHQLSFPLLELPSRNSFEYLVLLPFDVDQDMVGISRDLVDRAKQVILCTENTCGVSVHVGVSALHQGEDALRTAYGEAQRAIVSSPIADRRNGASRGHISTSYLDTMSRKLIEYYLKNQKIDQLEDMLMSYWDALTEKRTIDDQNSFAFLYEIINTMLQTLQSGIQAEMLQNSVESMGIVHPNTLSECRESLLQILRDLSTSYEDMPDNQAEIVSRLKNYIEDHYSEDLNLYDIAQNKFFMHPNYLSKLMKDSTGVSFSKYLLDVRMKNAVRLLERRDLSVSTVAQLVGYNSESYFVQVFHRYYGKTPGLYRKMLWAGP